MAILPSTGSATGRSPFGGATRILSGLLESRTGQTLSENRAWRMETALKPVLRAHGLADIDELAARIVTIRDRRLDEDVVNALLNNESSFFRDFQIFDMLCKDILPHIHAQRRDRTLRIWSAGSSTGQEAYSLAIQLRKDKVRWQGWRIEILATDISSSAIEQARSGVFSQIDVQRGLAIGDLLQWFEPVGDDWRANEELRRMIDFRTDNLFEPRAPSGAYDLILCRNVLLYFSPERRKAVFDLLAKHSHDQSILLLGAGETVIGQSDDFVAHREFRGSYIRKGLLPDSAGGPMRRTG